jgi:hypothetical protein
MIPRWNPVRDFVNKRKTPEGKWSLEHTECLGCGTQERVGQHRHQGLGLCRSCYSNKFGKAQSIKAEARRAAKRKEETAIRKANIKVWTLTSSNCYLADKNLCKVCGAGPFKRDERVDVDAGLTIQSYCLDCYNQAVRHVVP